MRFESGEYEIPEWANWIAQDRNGEWWTFEDEPELFYWGWWSASLYSRIKTRYICTEYKPTDFKQELYEVVWE